MNQRCCMPKQKKWDDCKCRDHEEHECRRCGDEPGKAILKCNNGFSVSNLLAIQLGTGGPFEAVPLGSVTINADRLCDPTILFTFSGRISVLAAGTITAHPATFRVTKTCNGIRQIIGTFSATISQLVTVNAADAFSYQVCDCNSCCCDCATYSLEYIPGGALGVEIGLSITNIVLSVLAVGKEVKDNDKDKDRY